MESKACNEWQRNSPLYLTATFTFSKHSDIQGRTVFAKILPEITFAKSVHPVDDSYFGTIFYEDHCTRSFEESSYCVLT